jgi:hypothetical protein
LVKPFGIELCCGLKLIQNCQKIEKKIQKVDTKLTKSCQKKSQKVVQKLSKLSTNFVALGKTQKKVKSPEKKNWKKKKKKIGIP